MKHASLVYLGGAIILTVLIWIVQRKKILVCGENTGVDKAINLRQCS